MASLRKPIGYFDLDAILRPFMSTNREEVGHETIRHLARNHKRAALGTQPLIQTERAQPKGDLDEWPLKEQRALVFFVKFLRNHQQTFCRFLSKAKQGIPGPV